MVCGKPDALQSVFEEGARFQGVRDGSQVRRGLGEFLAMVAEGPSTGATSPDDLCVVEFIDVTGAMAVLKVRDTFRGRTYVDYLTAVRLPTGWRIVNKAFITVDGQPAGPGVPA
jgi:hypothetical protein